MSPYNYAANNPINFTDPTGDTIRIRYKGKEYLYEEGALYLEGEEYTGKIKGFLKQTFNALNKTAAGGTYGAALVNMLQSSEHIYTIERSAKNGFTASNTRDSKANTQEFKDFTGDKQGSSGSGGTIKWNPNLTESGFNTNGNTSRPAFIGLAHEMLHASDAHFGILHGSEGSKHPLTGKVYGPTHDGLNDREWRAVFLENQIRINYSIPLRTHYGITNGQPTGPYLLDSSGSPRLPQTVK